MEWGPKWREGRVQIDQAEMEALIAQAQEPPADGATATATVEPPQLEDAAPPAARVAAPPTPAPKPMQSQFVATRKARARNIPETVAAPTSTAPEVHRILKIRVPVIVRLARRLLPIGTIRNLSNGAILEFEKSVDDDLELLINNRVVGYGSAVKVGENFGLNINAIGDAEQRIRSLGA